MIKKSLMAVAVGLVTSTSAFASDMYLSLPSNAWDAGRFISSGGIPFDANFRTANFDEFGFSQLLATSIYDFSDGSIFGAFYDTNKPAELGFAGVPAAGLALDGITPVSLVLPNCPLGQCDIDALSPLVPPLGTDNEGFLQTWDMQVEYHFDGVLTAAGPTYTGGTFDVYFNDLIGAGPDFLALTGTLTGSALTAPNLNLFFDITYAAPGFLWVDNGSGTFLSASAVIAAGGIPRLVLDTNVDPAIPTANQLLLVVDGGGTPNVIRQTRLDGSVIANIPEPGILALMSLGLLGLGLRRRKAA